MENNMTLKTQIIILVVVAATGVAVGRFTVPVKVVTEIKTVEVEKKTDTSKEKLNKKTHTETNTTVTKKPDGSEETVTKTVTDTGLDKDTSKNSNLTDSSNSDNKTERTSNTGHLNLSFLAGTNPLNPSINNVLNPILYGGIVTKDIVGPISCSIWGFSNGTMGIGIGLTF